MQSRRSRSSRARKARTPETPQSDVFVVAPAADPVAQLARQVDPSETAQLRALEAGWDELLS
jgi:hypothetical protein